MSLSLLDVADRHVAYWYVVYLNRENPRWWNKYLAPGFQHVQVWQPVPYGDGVQDKLWIVVDPCLERIGIDVQFEAQPVWVTDPGVTVQRVAAVPRERVVREWFSFGPHTCVETVKAVLGVRSWRIRTPLQLYRHIAKHGGVLISR